MKNCYSESQKIQVMLQSDLLKNPLTLAERIVLDDVFTKTSGNLQAFLEMLSSEEAEKVKELLGQGLKLSLELDKLSQRGVSIIFSEELPMDRIENFFVRKPSFLFVIGNRSFLEDDEIPFYLSLTAFKGADCNGIFIADRALDVLLRDEQVVASLRKSRALLISDMMKSHANIKSFSAIKEKGNNKSTNCLPSQKSVFVSGSRSQVLIPKVVQDSLEAIIDQNLNILIGDSDKGVDKEIIDFLRVPLYEKVTLFTISNAPRIKAESEWCVRSVETDSSLKAQERQMAKDYVMASEADWGMALFNPIAKNRRNMLQVSSGTLRNTIQMLLQGKTVKFFYLFERTMLSRNLKTLQDLEEVIESYKKESLTNAEIDDVLSARGVLPGSDASLVRFQKIFTKYQDLLKSEKKKLFNQNMRTATLSEPVQEVLPLFDD